MSARDLFTRLVDRSVDSLQLGVLCYLTIIPTGIAIVYGLEQRGALIPDADAIRYAVCMGAFNLSGMYVQLLAPRVPTYQYRPIEQSSMRVSSHYSVRVPKKVPSEVGPGRLDTRAARCRILPASCRN